MKAVALYVLLELAVLAALDYFSVCAGAMRWLTLREWWGCRKRPAASSGKEKSNG